MSRFPSEVLPGSNTGIDSAPYLGSPRIPNTGAGLAESLQGIGRGMAAMADAAQRRQDQEARESERLARMEEASRNAADQRYLIELETRLIEQRSAGKAAAAKSDPVEAGQAFDAAMRPLMDEIDAIERPDLSARARLQYTRAYVAGREDVAEIAARRISDESRASVSRMERTLMDGVILGDEEPEAAIERHAEAVRGLVGTAYTEQQAVASLNSFRSSVVSAYVDRLIDATAEDPSMAEPLREFLAGDVARTVLNPASRRRIEASLEDAEIDGEIRQWHTSVRNSREGLTAALLADDTPDYMAATADPQGTMDAIDTVVANLMAMPGREADASADRPPMSEAALRRSLLEEVIEASASSGNAELFALAVEAAKVPSQDGRSVMQPELASKVARLRSTLKVAETTRSDAKIAVDAISGAWATGTGIPPQYLRSPALDSWAKEAMVTQSAPSIARWLASEGALIPDSLLSRVHAGFSDGAQEGQIVEAIGVLEAIGAIDPEAARRIAVSSKASEAALTVLDLKGDASMARLLLSPEGSAGLDLARQALGKGIPDKDSATPIVLDTGRIFVEAGYDIGIYGLPQSARRAFEAGFRLEMATAFAQGVEPNTPERVDRAAAAAVSRVTRTHAALTVSQIGERGWLASMFWPNDISGVVFVDAAQFGIPSEAVGADKSTADLVRMLDNAQSSLNPAFGAPTGIVRPDLSLGNVSIGTQGLESEVLVPLVDHASLTAVGFAGWDPISKRWTRTIKPGSDDFRDAQAAFSARTPLDAIDYDAKFRIPPGTNVRYLSEWHPAMADLFRRTMEARYRSMAVGDISLGTYLDNQAVSLGWGGWKSAEGDEP